MEEEKWQNLIYKFQLKRSGKKAKLPSDNVLYLQINGVEKDNFPHEIKSHLEDGSNPLLQLQGKNVIASFSFTNKTFFKIAKSASFSLDGGLRQILILRKSKQMQERFIFLSILFLFQIWKTLMF